MVTVSAYFAPEVQALPPKKGLKSYTEAKKHSVQVPQRGAASQFGESKAIIVRFLSDYVLLIPPRAVQCVHA